MHACRSTLEDPTLERDGRALVAVTMALRKGDDEGIILVIADSAATLQRYADPFAAMVRAIGASRGAPPPAAPAAPAGGVDLRYRVPEGWTARNVDGGVLLERSVNTMYDKFGFRLLILPSQPLEGDLRAAFVTYWTATVSATMQTSIVPLPFMRHMRSGMALAYDLDPSAKLKNGDAVNGGLYILARGKRFVPIVAFFFGYEKGLGRTVEELIESAEIPGSGSESVALFAPADVQGSWSESSTSFASYVTPSGGYGGDASITTGSSITLGRDRSYAKTLIAITRNTRIKEHDEGTWNLDDAELKLTAKDRTRRYWVHAVGADPKVGSFLVLSTYPDDQVRPDLSQPRGAFQGLWFKRKD